MSVVRLNLRLPADLHAEAVELGALERLSLNAVIVRAVESAVRYHLPKARSARANLAGSAASIVNVGHEVARPLPSYPRPPAPSMVSLPKIGANQPCVCGSGLKFKKCCGKDVRR